MVGGGAEAAVGDATYCITWIRHGRPAGRGPHGSRRHRACRTVAERPRAPLLPRCLVCLTRTGPPCCLRQASASRTSPALARPSSSHRRWWISSRTRTSTLRLGPRSSSRS